MGNSADKIRNIGIAAHIDAGKTTISERLLFYTGKNHKMGEVHDGTATMDWMVQEQERGITITSAASSCDWKGFCINLIDTPGHIDFTIEVERSFRVLDGVVCVFCAVGGVEAQSETVWNQSERYNIPKIIFINKLDRKGADFQSVIKEIKSRFGKPVFQIVQPLNCEDLFTSFVDLINLKIYKWPTIDKNQGKDFIVEDVKDHDLSEITKLRNELVEIIAENDDEMQDMYLNGFNVDANSLQSAIRRLTIKNKFVPIVCGSALKNKGIQFLLDSIVNYLPSPLDRGNIIGYTQDLTNEIEVRPALDEKFSCIIFKISHVQFVEKIFFVRIYSGVLKEGDVVFNSTKNIKERILKIYLMHSNKRVELSSAVSGDIVAVTGLKNSITGDTLCSSSSFINFEKIYIPNSVITIAVEPKNSEYEVKLNNSLDILSLEDPSFKYSREKNTGQLLLMGMGELHLEIILDRLRREFLVEVNTGKPVVKYKESVKEKAVGEGIFDKELSTINNYAKCILEVNPDSNIKEVQIIHNSVGNLVSKDLLVAFKNIIINSCQCGPVFGYEMIGFTVNLIKLEISNFNIQSLTSSISVAFHQACKNAGPSLYEPIMELEIVLNRIFTGDIVQNLNIRRGKIHTIYSKSDEIECIIVNVPMSEMFGYSSYLRSATRGRASYSMYLKCYEELPVHLIDIELEKIGYTF